MSFVTRIRRKLPCMNLKQSNGPACMCPPQGVSMEFLNHNAQTLTCTTLQKINITVLETKRFKMQNSLVLSSQVARD